MDPCYGGDGHVQPIPSKWTKFRRCLRTSAGVNGRRLASLLNMHYLQPVILVTTALIVGLCEIINGAKVKSLATFYSNFFSPLPSLFDTPYKRPWPPPGCRRHHPIHLTIHSVTDDPILFIYLTFTSN